MAADATEEVLRWEEGGGGGSTGFWKKSSVSGEPSFERLLELRMLSVLFEAEEAAEREEWASGGAEAGGRRAGEIFEEEEEEEESSG